MDLDAFLATSQVRAKTLAGRTFRAFPLDFPHAYKHVGVAADQHDSAAIILRGPAGAPHMATHRAQPFGSRRAPANWDRATAFLQCALRRLFAVWMGVFAGDCFCAEPGGAVASAPSSVKAMCKLLGPTLAENKERPHCTDLEFLGAKITIQQDSATDAISAHRRNDYAVSPRNFLNRGTMAPCEAAKIR